MCVVVSLIRCRILCGVRKPVTLPLRPVHHRIAVTCGARRFARHLFRRRTSNETRASSRGSLPASAGHCRIAVRRGTGSCDSRLPLESPLCYRLPLADVSSSCDRRADAMNERLVLCETFDRIAVLTLNHPEKRNALSRAMLESLRARLRQIATDQTLKTVILRAAGSVFSA